MVMKGPFATALVLVFLLTASPLFAIPIGGSTAYVEEEVQAVGNPVDEGGLLVGDGAPVRFDPEMPRPLDHGRIVRTVQDLSILQNPLAGFSYIPFRTTGPAPSAGIKDENDAPDNATELIDGDSVTNNVTSWLSGTTIHLSDVDFYIINLTADGTRNIVDVMTVTIGSQDGVDKKAHLLVQCLYVDTLLGQFDVASFEVTGGLHGASSVIEITPEGDPSVNIVVPYFLYVYSFNSTKINYTISIDIVQSTRSEWNGIFGGGMLVNATKQPARMQSVQTNNDLYDWFDLTPLIQESAFDADRGDNVEVTLRVDVATEERGSMLGYAGAAVWNRNLLTTTILFPYFIYYNYTAQQLNVVQNQGNLPFLGILFGQDPVTVGFKGQVDHCWLGLHSTNVWIFQNQGYLNAEGTSRVQYNITNINFKLYPPNDPPMKTQNIPSFTYDEDTGPWLKVVDLEKSFYDKESQGSLRFVVRDADEKNSANLKAYIDDDKRHLNIEVLEPNWNGKSTFQIRCYDNGTDLTRDSIDDRWVDSNTFTVTVVAVNDDAYIEKVDMMAGSPKLNDHTPITYLLSQGQTLRDRRIYAYDNDTEDQETLVYTHNATTKAFTLKPNGMFNFIPTNDDVGVTWIGVYVDDGHSPAEDDLCILRFEVLNKNDPPVLSVLEWRETNRVIDLIQETEPVLRGVKEDMEINLTITVSDPDIEIGLADSLTWFVTSSGWKVHRHPFDPLKAYVTYTPTNDDSLVGNAETDIYVMDSNNYESGKVHLTMNIDNVNDRPRILSVNGEVPLKGKITLDVGNGKNAFEDRPFLLTVLAEEIDPRDSVTFKVDSSLFNLIRDQTNEFQVNFTMTPTQEMVGPGSILLTVTDESGEKDSIRIDYEVVNTNDAPERPGFEYDTYNLFTGKEINFTAKDNGDPDGDELTFHWDFGDGSAVAIGSRVSHIFRKANVYTVKVTAKDTEGLTTSFERSISIYDDVVIVDPDKDTDGDTIPDIWEDDNGMNKYVQDADDDPDKDGFTNLEEYKAKTKPLDPASHPKRIGSENSGLDPILIVIIIAAIVIVLAAVLFVFFVVLRPAKPVTPPQYYGMQYPGMPPYQQQPGLPGQPQQQIAPQQQPPMLPPAPPPPTVKEDDILKVYLDQAQQEMKADANSQAETDKNVWRPPADAAEEDKGSQVDDLFDEGSGKVTSIPALPEMPEL